MGRSVKHRDPAGAMLRWDQEVRLAPAGDTPSHVPDGDLAEAEAASQSSARPPKFAVVLLNDDYTTMEFVVEVLRTHFQKTPEQAMQVMLRVHQAGRGTAGVYTHEIAETKVAQVEARARSRGFPLRCEIEREGS